MYAYFCSKVDCCNQFVWILRRFHSFLCLRECLQILLIWNASHQCFVFVVLKTYYCYQFDLHLYKHCYSYCNAFWKLWKLLQIRMLVMCYKSYLGRVLTTTRNLNCTRSPFHWQTLTETYTRYLNIFCSPVMKNIQLYNMLFLTSSLGCDLKQLSRIYYAALPTQNKYLLPLNQTNSKW